MRVACPIPRWSFRVRHVSSDSYWRRKIWKVYDKWYRRKRLSHVVLVEHKERNEVTKSVTRKPNNYPELSSDVLSKS